MGLITGQQRPGRTQTRETPGRSGEPALSTPGSVIRMETIRHPCLKILSIQTADNDLRKSYKYCVRTVDLTAYLQPVVFEVR